jgi:hypothetical protein
VDLRAAVEREADACLAEISRQAEQLRQSEIALRERVEALEDVLREAKQTLSDMRPVYAAAV